MTGLAYAFASYKSRCCVCAGPVRRGDGLAIPVDGVSLAVAVTNASWAHQSCAKKRRTEIRRSRRVHARKGFARRNGFAFKEREVAYVPAARPSSLDASNAASGVYAPRLVDGDAPVMLMSGDLTRGLVDLALLGECDFEDVASRTRDLMLPLRQLSPPVGDGSGRRAVGPPLSDVAVGLPQFAAGEPGFLLHGAVEDVLAERNLLTLAHGVFAVTGYEVREHSFQRLVGAMRLRGLRIDVDELDRQLSYADAPPVLSRTKESLRQGRVHPTMDALQSSGRISVSSPAMLSFGRRGERVVARRVVIPEDGDVLMSVDLSQIEPRVVAALSQDPGMLDAFDAGMDFHSRVATSLFGGSEHRTLAKRFNNALLYGAGVDTLSENGGLPRDLVKEYTAEFAAQFPGWVAWSNDLIARARSGKFLDNEHGRVLKVQPRRAQTAAPATVAQSCARDIFADGVLRMHARGLSKYLRLLIHDEVLLSVPAGQYDEIAVAVLDCLSTSWSPSYASRPVAIKACIGRPGANWAAVYEGG